WRWLQRQPYFPALAAWLYYLGIEPFLRRRWPHRLIAWARLLEGRVADPIVGRQLLLGILVGAGVVFSGCLLDRSQDLSYLTTVLPIGSAAGFWSSTAYAAGTALINSLGSFAMLLVIRVLLRREIATWVALAILWMIVSLPSGNVSIIEVAGLAVGTAFLLLAMRMGLLVTFTAWATNLLLLTVTPLTLDFSRWYAWQTVAIATLLLGIAVWGFRASVGRRRFLSASMFEG
ncbi:MAG TPA: hypothetical protein VIX13_05460, partial [Candidatus Eisenbacteria bacterium]